MARWFLCTCGLKKPDESLKSSMTSGSILMTLINMRLLREKVWSSSVLMETSTERSEAEEPRLKCSAAHPNQALLGVPGSCQKSLLHKGVGSYAVTRGNSFW